MKLISTFYSSFCSACVGSAIGLFSLTFLFHTHTALADSHQSFTAWQAELRTEALSKGISADTFDMAFVGVAPITRVLELDRSQPEFTLTLDSYLNKVVSATR